LIGNLFPDRQLVIRARGQVSYVVLSTPLQIAAIMLAVVSIGWATYATVYYSTFDWVLREKNQQIAEARIAYRNVMDEVGNYNARLMAITQNLERSQLDLLSRLDMDGSIAAQDTDDGRDRMEELSRAMTWAARKALTKQIEGVEEEWRELAARNATLEHGLASIGSEVDEMLAATGEIQQERDDLRNQVGQLETALGDMRVTQEALIDRLSERTSGTIAQIEIIVGMTGLDTEKLVARVAEATGGDAGQGGPYVALPSGAEDPLDHKVAVLDLQIGRWQNLRQVLNYLPLAAPVEYYRLASAYGKRRDPVTRRWAQHNGVDLSYHLNTPILSPAPGRVVFTGWRGGLGRVIEIDHGMGLRTRYGHLKKILVKRGQKVGYRDKIGLLGSSGRSTGPHVHYEILVDGKPHDPLKFIKAGKYAFKG
jgi:murein DD-endopeptidase MepM/ murein hydrolase activator NlpD